MATLDWSHFGHGAMPAQLMLLCLEQGPMQARELLNELERSYDLYLEPGMLLGVLSQLERRGWIRASGAERLARLYVLTEQGMAVIARQRAAQAESSERIGTPAYGRRRKGYCMNMLNWIMRLYPRAWRERYEDEMRALLEEHEITMLTLLDLLLGALDARLDPHYRTLRSLSPLQRLQRMRTASIIAFCALPISFFFYGALIVDQVDEPWDILRKQQQPVAVLASNLATVAISILGVVTLAAILILVYRYLRKSASREEAKLNLLPLCGVLSAGGAVASHFLLPYSWPWLNQLQFLIFLFSLFSIPTSIALVIARSKIGAHPPRIFLLLGTLAIIGLIINQISMGLYQGITSFLWPDGNWSLQLIAGLCLTTLPAIIACWLLIRAWLALPPSHPSAPAAEAFPLQASRRAE